MNASTQSHRDPTPGAIFADRYRIERLIARGGMAAVYLARQVTLNRLVALKVLSPPADSDESQSFEHRFRLEAETLAALQHPNIVVLHDFGQTTDDRFYLAMEYVEGPRLSDVLRDGPMAVERALRLIIQVVSALRYAHKRGVVHRDLKPSNLLIASGDAGEDLVKVVDFGLVKLTETDQAITRAGLILGSPHCMAPEQIRGGDIDHRVDIYAIGVLLFRAITGQYPFHGTNSAATMIAHLNQPTPTFFSVSPDLSVPIGLEEIVQRCLAKKPADRYADMASLLQDLASCVSLTPEQFLAVSGTQTIAAIREKAPSRSMAARFAPWLAAAGFGIVLLIAVASGLGWWMSHRESPVIPAEISKPVEIPRSITVPVPAPAPIELPTPEELEAPLTQELPGEDEVAEPEQPVIKVEQPVAPPKPKATPKPKPGPSQKSSPSEEVKPQQTPPPPENVEAPGYKAPDF